MARQIRIKPIPSKASDIAVMEFFEKNISFSKLERLKALQVVILSFSSDLEFEKAFVKLQSLSWGKEALEMTVIGRNQDAKIQKEIIPDLIEIQKLPYFSGTTAALAGIIKHAGDAIFRKDENGRNLIHWISRNDCYSDDQAEMLLKSGFKIDEMDLELKTPLHHAYRASFAKWLIGVGAEIDSRDKYGKTPMHWAAANGYLDICKVLLDHGADINAKANDNASPWDVRFKSLDFEKQLHHLGARSGQGETKLTQTKEPDWVWFWSFFSADSESSVSVRLQTLSNNLDALSPEKIGEFSDHLLHLVREGYQRSVCGFSLAIQGQTTDDDFEDFVYWIISKGRDFYEQALKDADELVDFTMDWNEFDQFMMKEVIQKKYAEKANASEKYIDIEMIPCSIRFVYKSKANGEDFEWSEEQLRKKFPKLVDRFGK
jgi:hypothetical protein